LQSAKRLKTKKPDTQHLHNKKPKPDTQHLQQTIILVRLLLALRSMSYYADLAAKVQALTADQVKAALRKHLDLSRLVVITAGDFANKRRTKSKPR